jgi:RHS repeat-associated protein
VLNQGFGLTAFSNTSNVSFSLSATYGWDQEGRLISLGGSGGSFTYGYDAMGRLSTMASGGTTIATASYNQADEVSGMTYDSFSETRSYDPAMLELTRITTQQGSSTIMDMSYAYTAGQNNGRISQATDWILGETANYAYDSLSRLVSAQASSGAWGNAYSYDGFGNLTAKAVTVGSAPTFSASYNGATNQMIGGSYDANGNDVSAGRIYDMENRLAQVTDSGQAYPQWGYDPWGKRIVEQGFCNAGGADCLLIHFYSITGQRLATSQGSAVPTLTQYGMMLYSYQAAPTANVYFGGKLIRAEGVTVATDRLGSVRANANGTQIRYFPFGEERTSTADNVEKFGSYFKDTGGMYYADQRHYNYIQGRFLTPDAAGMGAVDPGNPTSWNGYSYVGGDPVNHFDPTGTTCVAIGEYWASSDMYGCAFLGQRVHPLEDCPEYEPQCRDNSPSPPVTGAPDNPGAKQPPQIWDLDVGYTPVTTYAGAQYDHLFLWVHQAGTNPSSSLTGANSIVYDGGPSVKGRFGRFMCPWYCGNVVAWETVTGHYQEILNPDMVDFFSEQLTPTELVSLQNGFTGLANSPSVPYHLDGPNSNSVAYTLLADAGIAVPTITSTLAFGKPAGTLNLNGVLQVFTGWGDNLQHP